MKLYIIALILLLGSISGCNTPDSKTAKTTSLNRTGIFFITGACGCGKSTLTKLLKEKLSENLFAVYDFDEIGVPPGADATWRQAATDDWLKQAAENVKKAKSTVICGQSSATEIINSPTKPNSPLYFGFMKISDELIQQRLQERAWNTKLVQDNINWAHRLEKEVHNQKNHKIVDCSVNTPEHIADEFVTWILKETD